MAISKMFRSLWKHHMVTSSNCRSLRPETEIFFFFCFFEHYNPRKMPDFTIRILTICSDNIWKVQFNINQKLAVSAGGGTLKDTQTKLDYQTCAVDGKRVTNCAACGLNAWRESHHQHSVCNNQYCKYKGCHQWAIGPISDFYLNENLQDYIYKFQSILS